MFKPIPDLDLPSTLLNNLDNALDEYENACDDLIHGYLAGYLERGASTAARTGLSADDILTHLALIQKNIETAQALRHEMYL